MKNTLHLCIRQVGKKQIGRLVLVTKEMKEQGKYPYDSYAAYVGGSVFSVDVDDDFSF